MPWDALPKPLPRGFDSLPVHRRIRLVTGSVTYILCTTHNLAECPKEQFIPLFSVTPKFRRHLLPACHTGSIVGLTFPVRQVHNPPVAGIYIIPMNFGDSDGL